MSAATPSSTETIFVRLLGEGVDVWRPVAATPLGGDVLRLDDAPVPPDEEWEFRPGDRVHAGLRQRSEGPVRMASAAVRGDARRVG